MNTAPTHPSSLSDRTEALEKLRLRAALKQGLAELEQRVRDCHTLEGQLTRFADEYFKALGDSTTQLLALTPDEAGAPTLPVGPLDAWYQQRDTQTKTHYRRIMKSMHPDVRADTDAVQLLRVQQAYRRGDVATLLCLEFALSPPPVDAPETTRVALEARLEQVQNAIATTEMRAQELRQSALYACWQRATTERLAGRDWVAIITARLKQELRNQRFTWIANNSLTPQHG